MKKLFAILLAVAMIAAMAVVASATDITSTSTGSNTDSITVSGKYIAGGADIDTYKVTITWADMKFNYTDVTRIWDADAMEWDNDVEAVWTVAEGSSNSISLANASNKDVVATFAWDADDEYAGITAVWTGLTNGAVTVGNALSGTEGTATVTFTPAGALDKDVTNMTEIGSITVTITDVVNPT